MRFLLTTRFQNVCKNLSRSMHLEWSPNWKISKKIWDRYRKLPIQNCKVQVTYVWIDGTGENLRARTRTMDYMPTSHKDCPNWDFDGSATYLADVRSSDVILCPIALYNDPINQGHSKIALCETYSDDGKPTKSNHRHGCMETLNKACGKEPMFGFEQQFHLMDINNRPFGWPMVMGEYSRLGSYYCSVGADKAFGREIIECLYRCCLYSGVEIAGTNPKTVPSLWEFQTGPTLGMKAADDLWMARYLLQRISEDFGVVISFTPKILPDWTGAGCHATFSTKEMREEGGYKFIEDAMKKLEKDHQCHLQAFDPRRGQCKEQKESKFTSGVADRTCSVRISKNVAQQKKGYFEDRRPPANADPYQIVNALTSTLCVK